MSNWTSLPGNARNGQGAFTSTWITDDYEYALLIRHDWHPIVCQRSRKPSLGAWQTHDIYDTVIGIIAVDDSHRCVSIAVDSNGKIHVLGNTHDMFFRHVQTTNAHDITTWEEAPRIQKMAKWFTNMVENGVVENNQDGWSTLDVSRFTMDRVTHPYGWGSSTGNDTSCFATRLTRTGTAPDSWIGIGQARSISGNGFVVTPGQKYNVSLSFKAVMATPVSITHQMWIIWRNGNTEISRVASDYWTTPNTTLWYRPSITETIAPAGVDNLIIEFGTSYSSGNAVAGDAMWVDGLMLYEGDAAGDIVYRDGAYNGGLDRSGWSWDGTPYASTSQGPIRATGYAGLNEIGYGRFLAFSDGTLLLSGSQPVYVGDPVGRAWSMWKMEPSSTEFVPLQDGSDGCTMRNTLSHLKQGAAYPVLSEGNPANDDDIADRVYAYGTFIDKQDVLHVFYWFRVHTDNSYGALSYICSRDKGQTWENISGDPVTLPLTYPSSLDNTMVSLDGITPIQCSVFGGVTEIGGRPYGIFGLVGGGNILTYWDGSAWQTEDLDSYAFEYCPTVQNIRGDIWIFGTKYISGKGKRALWGVNHTQNSGLIVRFGAVNIGTPDGVYQFESGATYEGAPTHAGGLDNRGNYIFKRLLPDNDSPRIVQLGEGVHGKVV